MTKKKRQTGEAPYASRRKEVLKKIKGEAALFPAAPEQTRSRDQRQPYRQNSDFYYLTGFNEPEAALLLLGGNKGPRSVLFLRERDPQREQWTSEIVGLRRAKRRFDVDEVRDIRLLKENFPELIAQSKVLHYPPGIDLALDRDVFALFQTPLGPRLEAPHTLKDARLLTGEMRAVKDKHETAILRHAADITVQAFLDFLPLLREMRSEKHAAQALDTQFARLGADGPAFPTIVASGKNATFLHHEPKFQPLWKRELVLIDAGASFNGYAADMTRTLPVSGSFSDIQAQAYDIIYAALQQALAQAKPGGTLEMMHDAAVQALTAGLVDLGVLRGSVSRLVQSGAYRPYFMHRIGHWLGLDVHDLAPIYRDGVLLPPFSRPLAAGNALTVEPGLYFDPHDQTLPAPLRGLGIRIEEDVYITNTGHEVLTGRMPSKREDVEALMAACLK